MHSSKQDHLLYCLGVLFYTFDYFCFVFSVGVYPPLPDLQTVDFSLLREQVKMIEKKKRITNRKAVVWIEN